MKKYDYTIQLKQLISNNSKKARKGKVHFLKYAVDKNNNRYSNCYFESEKRLKNEIEFARFIENKTGYTVYLVPKTKTQNVKTPDFWIKDIDELWDLKGIYGSGKNRINNIFYKSKKQTENIILKINNKDLETKIIINEIGKIFDNNKHHAIKQVVLIDYKYNIQLFYKR